MNFTESLGINGAVNSSNDLFDGVDTYVSNEDIASQHPLENQVMIIHQYFEFINFYVYSLTSDSQDHYLLTYVLLSVVFVGITGTLFIISP